MKEQLLLKRNVGISFEDIPEGSVHPSNVHEIIEAWSNTKPLPIGTKVKIGKMSGEITGYGSSWIFAIGNHDRWQIPNYHVKYGRYHGAFGLDDEKLVLPIGADRSYKNGDLKKSKFGTGGGFF